MPPTAVATSVDQNTSPTTKQRIAATTDRLLDRAEQTGDPERQQLLDRVILLNAPVARSIATRYRSRGVDTDDLEQVAYLGLVKAAHGYRPAAATEFLAYAVPTIRGELKRYFRDCAWTVRPPRRLQELQGRIAATEPQLTQELGHLPDAEEMAQALELETTDVDDAEAARGCFTTLSLDAPGTTESGTGLVETLGDTDDGYGQVEAIRVLAPAVSGLGERDRRILELRFGCGLTQEEIGRELGVSQMQVSRLLRGILDRLRSELTSPPLAKSA
jgi:RNA polymerase sigma-B factor